MGWRKLKPNSQSFGLKSNALATVYKTDELHQYYHMVKNDLPCPCERDLFLHEKYKIVHKKLTLKSK